MIPILPNNPSTNVSNLWVWGSNANYRTGLGTNTGVSDITNINAPIGKDAKKWTVVGKGTPSATGYIGINNGRLYAWGTLKECNIGISASTADVVFQKPTQIHPDTDWIDCAYQNYAITQSYSLFLKSSGLLYQCGIDSDGKFQLVSNYPEWDQIDCGGGYQGAIKKNGQLFGWGRQSRINRLVFGLSSTGSDMSQASYINILDVSSGGSPSFPGYTMYSVTQISLGEDYGLLTASFPYVEGTADLRPRANAVAAWGEYSFGETAQNITSGSIRIKDCILDGTTDPRENQSFMDISASTEVTVTLQALPATTIDRLEPTRPKIMSAGNQSSGATALGSFSGNITVLTEGALQDFGSKISLTNCNGSSGTLLLVVPYSTFKYAGSGDGNPNGGASSANLINVPNVIADGISDVQGGNECGFLFSDLNVIP